MSIRRCKGCGGEFRKGRLAFLFGDGGVKGSLVCPRCEKRGVLLVPILVAPKVDGGKAARRSEREVLEPFVKNLRGKVKAMKTMNGISTDEGRAYVEAKIEAMEAVVTMLEEGRA